MSDNINIHYRNDGKEKRQSHEIHIDFAFSDYAIYASFGGEGLGASKDEAIIEAKRMVAETIQKLQNINWELIVDD